MAKMDSRELRHLKKGIHMLRWRVFQLTKRMELRMEPWVREWPAQEWPKPQATRRWNLSELDGEWQ